MNKKLVVPTLLIASALVLSACNNKEKENNNKEIELQAEESNNKVDNNKVENKAEKNEEIVTEGDENENNSESKKANLEFTSEEVIVDEIYEEDGYFTIKVFTEQDEENQEIEENTENNEELPNNIVHIRTKEEKLYNNEGEKLKVEDLKKGDTILFIVKRDSIMTLQYPPTYVAHAIVLKGENFIDIDKYDESHINSKNTLSLKLNKNTSIETIEGKMIDNENAKNREMIVFYKESTRSIPAQVTPVKIITLKHD